MVYLDFIDSGSWLGLDSYNSIEAEDDDHNRPVCKDEIIAIFTMSQFVSSFAHAAFTLERKVQQNETGFPHGLSNI